MVRHDGEELKVCGLSGGGNRIRTIGPAPAKALFWALPIGDGGTKRRSHLQVQVRDGDACLEWLRIGFPFAVGPRVRIRLPPAVSQANFRIAGLPPLVTRTACAASDYRAQFSSKFRTAAAELLGEDGAQKRGHQKVRAPRRTLATVRVKNRDIR